MISKAQPLQSDESKVPSVQDESVQDESAQDESAQDESAQDESAQDESAQDESAQDESAQDESKPTDQPVIEPVTELRTPYFEDHVPLINDDILFAPEPYFTNVSTVVANAKSNANNAVSARVLAVAVIMTPIYLSIFSFSNGTMQPMGL